MNRKGKVIEHYFTASPKSKPSYGLIRTYLRNIPFKFVTSSGVFSRRHVDLGTRLLAENMILPERGNALDVGCGYGAVGLAAAVSKPGLHVFLVDVNIRAVRLARKNAEINGIENAEVRRGHLYEPVRDVVFDCVLSNPPVSAGLEIVKAMITEAPQRMADKALFQMVVKSKIGGKRLCAIFEGAFGNVGILARGSGYRVLMSEKH